MYTKHCIRTLLYSVQKGDNIMGYINESVIYNIYPLGFAEHQRKMISNRNTDLTKFTAGLTI